MIEPNDKASAVSPRRRADPVLLCLSGEEKAALRRLAATAGLGMGPYLRWLLHREIEAGGAAGAGPAKPAWL